MDFNELAERLLALNEKVKATVADRVLIPAANNMLAEYRTRIFDKGLDSEGNKIGDYSRKPAYFTEDQFVRKGAFHPIGKGESKRTQLKTKVSVVKTKKSKSVPITKGHQERKSMYLQGGYAQFREIQARQADYKDFRLSGSLEKNTQVVRIDAATVGLALTDEKESIKRVGVERQVGKPVFRSAQTDRDAFKEAAIAEFEYLKKEI